MSIRRHITSGTVALVAVLVIAGCSSTKDDLSAGTKPQPVPAAVTSVTALHGSVLPYGKKLKVHVTNGAFDAVVVKQAGLGHLSGTLNKRRTVWTSDAVLAPSSHIQAKIHYVDLNHANHVRALTAHTPSAKGHFATYLSPSGGVTVGIAEPIIVTFDHSIPVKQRAAAEAGLTVTTSPHVVGAWHWFGGTAVHWRPASYWKAGTKVTVSDDMQGVKISHGVWGAVGRHSASFRIGAAHISEADQATHEMKVYSNGKLIRTLPISTGRDQYPTMDGIHIALQKNPVIEMNSATVGIPKGNPDYYDETVYWDVRISNGGEFVHAAPWSLGDQGNTNVSHGCVNVSTANAEWFYNFARVGDVVDIFNGARPVERGDAGTADWNMSWKQWLAGDAAPTAAAKHLHARYPRSYEPNFTPAALAHHAAKSHHKHEAAKKAKNKSSSNS